MSGQIQSTNSDPGPVGCPKCGAEIEGLETSNASTTFWSVGLSKVADDGLTWDETDVSDNTSEDFTFSCPSCGEELFTGGEEEAEHFLRTGETPSGQKAEAETK